MIFSVKDSLRQAVEAASGGLATVMYTKKGQPVFLRRIPRFNLEDIDPSLGTGPHPAFVIGGETKSEIWIGMYPGVISQGELVSVPGVNPTLTTFANAAAAAQAAGPGFHLITNAEWMAVALLHWKANGGQEVLRGNTDRGRSHEAPWETATRADGRAPGDPTGDYRTLTGSGPLTWRHDGSAWGIADMAAPWQWVAGLRLVNGEIQIIPNNDAALNPDSGWQAILPSGQLVAPGTGGTLKYDIPEGTQYTDDNVIQQFSSARLGTTRTAPPAGWDENNVIQDIIIAPRTTGLTVDAGVTVPPLLLALGLGPWSGVKGRYILRPYGTRYGYRGHFYWAYGGLFTVGLDGPPYYLPARPAFVL